METRSPFRARRKTPATSSRSTNLQNSGLPGTPNDPADESREGEDFSGHPARALLRIAQQLDQWANESKSGGWSTHQVTPMRALADEIRCGAAMGTYENVLRVTEAIRRQR